MSESQGPTDDEKKPLPKSQEVLASISGGGSPPPSERSRPEKQYKRKTEGDEPAQQMKYAHLKGVQDHYKHKGGWSVFLMLAVGGMIVFQSILLVCVGLGVLDFTEYEWLLPALLVQNLGQVIGLAVYAVKYLFSDISNQD